METWQVTLFGKLSIKQKECELEGIDSLRVQELLCYLLLHRNRYHSREVLASVLWGSFDTAHSKKYLRQALWQLQSALDSRSQTRAAQLLHVEPEWVEINPEASLCLDVALFEQCAAQVRGIAGQDLTRDQAQVLKEGLRVYRGDLLEGWFEEWCLGERERLQNILLLMLDKLMAYCETHQEYEAGLDYGTRILHYDCAREQTHARMMRLYCLSGDRTGALRQYDRCVAALQKELGVKPEERTVALYHEIRANRIQTAARPSNVALSPHVPPVTTLSDLLVRLRQTLEMLANVQQQLQQEIQAIEGRMKPES